MMVSAIQNEVSVYILSLINGFGIELGGAEVDDSITLWTHDYAVTASLVIEEGNSHSFYQYFYILETLGG